MKPIYLDYNATTPIAREVADAMAPYLYDHFGNPSSSHPYGLAARQAVESARDQVAALLGCAPREVIFTSGGTEANNYAIKGAALANRERGDHVITTAVEHPAVINVVNWLGEQGFRTTVLPVDEYGQVSPADLEAAIDDGTILVTVMHANNEVGTIQPIAALAEIAHAHGALMHTDAAQSVAKIPVDVDTLGVDLLSVAGHKLYAPKGIGALYVRAGVTLAPLLHGAGHEGGRRPGTENVLEIVGLGKACEIGAGDLAQNMAHFQATRDRLHAGLRQALGHEAVSGVTGSDVLGRLWGIVIVTSAALMLIGATNTGFAGARGLWVTMARDNLLPRLVLDQNDRGAHGRINTLFVVTIFALCYEADANIEVLERWYGASFGLVMFSGVVAFILLRRFKADDRRIYRAPWNIKVGKITVPIAAIVGVVVLSFALLGLYTRFAEQILDLQDLFVTVAMAVVAILLGHNHRPLLRMGYQYFRRVIESVESEVIETEDRTIVVSVGGVRIGRLLQNAIEVARAQGKASGIPYRQIVVFHMTRTVEREAVYKVTRDSIRPSSIEGNVVRIHTELTELAPPDLTVYLALVPNRNENKDTLHAAMDALVDFHEKHGFKGHIVVIGDYGITDEDKADLQRRLVGSTLLPVPV